MTRVARTGLLGIGLLPALIIILSGCGWEPLVPPEASSGDAPATPPLLQAKIVYDCEVCSQAESITPPLTITFKAQISLADSSDEEVLIYSWNFGDGTLGEGEQVTHTYERPGTYYVRLRVITSSGLEAYDEAKITVQPPPKPEPRIQRDVSEGEICSFERLLPEEIAVGDRFTVQVTIRAKQDLQIVSWQDNVWFPEFRLFQDPTQVWIGMKAGETKILLYDVELWQTPIVEDVWMSGTLRCNLGGNHESEVHTLKSLLNVIREDSTSAN